MSSSQRASGILVHPTSFPSRFGIGDLGSASYEFIDFLAATGQQLWQVLPLGPTGYGNSPYLSYSAMAGNPLLISPECLRDDGWLTEDDLNALPTFPTEQVDFDQVAATKLPLLQKACQRFQTNCSPAQKSEFEAFCQAKAYWLDDYALFMALKENFGGIAWYSWEPSIVDRQPVALEACRQHLEAEIFFQKFLQFEFFRQWANLKQYARDRKVEIIGDIPIYVAPDSADVWACRENFCLDEETGEPALMAGVPPDYFSETGQLWGNPVYNWEQLQANDFDWWIKRFQAMLELTDWIRIDHFRAFQAYWAVQQGETTAINGEWLEAPGEAFFKTLAQKLGKLPILAEDLGMITPEVIALRDQFEFPGMKVLHFAFGSDRFNPFLPYNYPQNCLVYTGTHDNNTTVGWFKQIPEYERENVIRYLGQLGPDGIHWDLIRLALGSVGDRVIIPLQDILGLDESGRMNFPGKPEGNWGWRYRSEMLTSEVRDRLRSLTETYGRNPL